MIKPKINTDSDEFGLPSGLSIADRVAGILAEATLQFLVVFAALPPALAGGKRDSKIVFRL
ncbi:hypothetical protein LV84_00170 [Algoriphagus ratkowskyi]|uniref:Uncharacterized protein n=1 Tax=Algoriphagus ratkowskyi TaxID=57028 RepID=A0A2W7TD18_9BACT|nr:hypothetical protein [Algoriphagus ratkowskyi]PZX61182.1 hypothetical protein LV84_00170 [Algoriphagus ratkowskyi]TXD79305.1 hypothetical protein ESW18_03480 [Algoriphagus ratkowskyi]